MCAESLIALHASNDHSIAGRDIRGVSFASGVSLLRSLGLVNVDLDRFQDAIALHAEARFIPVAFEHELQRVAKVPPALLKCSAKSDGPRNLLDPAHKPSVSFRPNDGVVTLLHAGMLSIWGVRRQAQVPWKTSRR